MASQATEIENAVVSILDSLVGDDIETIVKRARPAVAEGDTLPLLCVSALSDRYEHADFEDEWLVYYTVSVVLVTKKTTLASDASARQWRETIIRGLTMNRTGWTGVTGWNDCNAVGRNLIDPGLLDKGYHYTPLAFEVQTLETWP